MITGTSRLVVDSQQAIGPISHLQASDDQLRQTVFYEPTYDGGHRPLTG